MKKQELLDMIDILKKNILDNPLTKENIEDEFKVVEMIILLSDE